MPARVNSEPLGVAASDAKLEHDRKRLVDHRRKWLGGHIVVGSKVVPKRVALNSASYQHLNKVSNYREHRQNALSDKGSGKHPAHHETTDDSDSMGLPEEEDGAKVPVDDGVTYSYDAPGPTHGSDILTLAVNKAVERYENKITDKLVKDEYEVVRNEDEEPTGYTADDDFELL